MSSNDLKQRNQQDHIGGWRYVARVKYEEDSWGRESVDVLMRRVNVIEGMVSISESDLKDLLTSAWIDGKED